MINPRRDFLFRLGCGAVLITIMWILNAVGCIELPRERRKRK